MNLVAYIDGTSLGNPGAAGYGVVLKNEGGKVLKSVGRYIGRATNNTAEYRGLLGCLELVKEYEAHSLTVYSDSQLLVNQVKGIYRVRKSHLRALHAKTLEEMKVWGIHIEIHHIPRRKNWEADGLARQAVRLGAKKEKESESPQG